QQKRRTDSDFAAITNTTKHKNGIDTKTMSERGHVTFEIMRYAVRRLILGVSSSREDVVEVEVDVASAAEEED
nr:hypothetical protein [Tanacetum cinerariifolium]